MSESNSTESGVYMIRCRERQSLHRLIGQSRQERRLPSQVLGKRKAFLTASPKRMEQVRAGRLRVVSSGTCADRRLDRRSARLLLLEREQHHMDSCGGVMFNKRPKATSNLGIKYGPEFSKKIGDIHRGRKRSDKIRANMSAAARLTAQRPEWLARVASAQREKWQDPECRAKMIASFQGRKYSEEHRTDMSATRRGRKQPPEAIAKTANANRGKPFTEERKARISAALQGRKLSPEHVAKSAASRRGKKQSPEHIAKRAASVREYHRRRKEASQKQSSGKLVQGQLFD